MIIKFKFRGGVYMQDNFEPSLKFVLRHEGGYSNEANDAGGPTQCGIIQAEYDAYRRRKGLIPRHVSSITPTERDEIYRACYWDLVRANELPYGVDYATFDAAVNSGPVRGVQWLQRAINAVAGTTRLTVDGHIGAMTLDAAGDYPADKLINAMLDARIGFMKVARNSKTGAPLWPSFGGGWTARLFGELMKGGGRAPDGVLQQATAMAFSAARPVPGTTTLPAIAKVPLPQPTPSPATHGTSIAVTVAGIIVAIIAGISQWL